MARAPHVHKWSGEVTRNSNALDLENGIFKSDSARQIALSLKHSAESSRRRKGTPFQSTMSMLNFYINRGGSALSMRQRAILSETKEKLREEFHKPDRPEAKK